MSIQYLFARRPMPARPVMTAEDLADLAATGAYYRPANEDVSRFRDLSALEQHFGYYRADD